MTATLTVRFELEPTDDDAMYRLEALLLSDPDGRSWLEHCLNAALASALYEEPGGEWGVKARLVGLRDERGTNVWQIVVE